MKELLALRKKINAKRPAFKRGDWQKRVEIGLAWRRPRGLHNKMRKGVWGKPATVNVGYRGPVAVRGLSPTGLKVETVYTVESISKLDGKKHAVIVGNVGGRLRVKLLEECKKKNISVLNHKSVDESIKAVAGALNERKQDKKSRAEKRAKREAPKKKSAKPAPEAPKTQEEIKQEKDKVLTQRDA